METEKNFTIDSNKLIKTLLENETIEYIGTGDRYDDASGLHNDCWTCDNTYNWEIMEDGDDDGTKNFYTLSNNFEIKEYDRFLVLSKHIGADIRAGYKDDIIYLKRDKDDNFYMMIDELKLELAVEDK